MSIRREPRRNMARRIAARKPSTVFSTLYLLPLSLPPLFIPFLSLFFSNAFTTPDERSIHCPLANFLSFRDHEKGLQRPRQGLEIDRGTVRRRLNSLSSLSLSSRCCLRFNKFTTTFMRGLFALLRLGTTD